MTARTSCSRPIVRMNVLASRSFIRRMSAARGQMRCRARNRTAGFERTSLLTRKPGIHNRRLNPISCDVRNVAPSRMERRACATKARDDPTSTGVPLVDNRLRSGLLSTTGTNRRTLWKTIARAAYQNRRSITPMHSQRPELPKPERPAGRVYGYGRECSD